VEKSKDATTGAGPVREAIGELLATSGLVTVVFVSGTVRVQLGAGGIGVALLGSILLGFGYGLVIWSFGSLSGAQTNPLVSIIASLLGGQRWSRTLLRIAAQIAGAAATGALVPKVVAYTVVAGDVTYAGSAGLAEAVAAFGFVLVALAVAHRRNVRVPVALGAFATASFWMTGHATVGNPLLSSTLGFVTNGRNAAKLLSSASVVSAAAVGASLAVLLALFLFPNARDAAKVLLFVPADENVTDGH
jgi:glycerol uptake facilitator-like aquaporin